jgi:hypothetical protein
MHIVANRLAMDIAFVRARTGIAHVSDPDALAAFSDGRGVFDVDPDCRKLDAFVAKHGFARWRKRTQKAT